jgi:enoyl-CoA hydratase
MPAVTTEKDGPVSTIILNRPRVRNAVDRESARQLADAFRAFDADGDARVAILYGEGGHFCAGADLKQIASGRPNRVEPTGECPIMQALPARIYWFCKYLFKPQNVEVSPPS